MEAACARRRHHLFDGVADERVDELVGQQMAADADEEAAVDQLVEPGTDFVGGHVGREREHPELDPLTRHRGQLERPPWRAATGGPCGRRRLLDRVGRTDRGDVAAHRPAVLVPCDDTVVEQMPPQLADEERVAAAALGRGRGQDAQVAVELLVERSGDELLDAGRVEPTQTEPGSPTRCAADRRATRPTDR